MCSSRCLVRVVSASAVLWLPRRTSIIDFIGDFPNGASQAQGVSEATGLNGIEQKRKEQMPTYQIIISEQNSIGLDRQEYNDVIQYNLTYHNTIRYSTE